MSFQDVVLHHSSSITTTSYVVAHNITHSLMSGNIMHEDDLALSENQWDSVVTMKESWPHPEGKKFLEVKHENK